MAALYKVRLAPIMRHGKLLQEGDTFEAEESEVVNLVIGSDPVVELVKPVKSSTPTKKPEPVSQFAPPKEVVDVETSKAQILEPGEKPATTATEVTQVTTTAKPKYIKP